MLSICTKENIIPHWKTKPCFYSQEHGCGDYFLLEHYVPESLILNTERFWPQAQLPNSINALKMQLQQAHRDRRGLDSTKAEEMFVTYAQSLADYGSHYYIATTDARELAKIVARIKKGEKKAMNGSFESENIYSEKRESRSANVFRIFNKFIGFYPFGISRSSCVISNSSHYWSRNFSRCEFDRSAILQWKNGMFSVFIYTSL